MSWSRQRPNPCGWTSRPQMVVAAPLGQPPGQLGVGVVAGMSGQGGEEAVDSHELRQPPGMCDREGGGASVAEVGHGDVLFGGQGGGAEGAEDVVVGGGAGVAAGSEAVQHPQAGEGAEAVFGGVEMTEGELGELVAGQDSVLQEQPAQLAVAVGEPSGQVGHSEGDPIGPRPSCSTAGSRHPVHRR